MADTKKEKAVKYLTPVGRLLYPHLAHPDSGKQYSDDKYKTSLIVSKEELNKSGIFEAIKELAKAEKVDINSINYQIQDLGSEEQRAKKLFASGDYKDFYLIQAKSKFPIRLVDGAGKNMATEDAEKIKSGDLGRIGFTMKFYASNSKAIGKGIAFYLTDAQFWKEGERIGGAETPFGTLEVVEEDGTAEESEAAFGAI